MIDSLSQALDKLKVTRRLGYLITLYITVYATNWSLDFPVEAIGLGYSAGEVAMVVGAVMAPVTLLQGYVINSYNSKGTHNVSHNPPS